MDTPTKEQKVTPTAVPEQTNPFSEKPQRSRKSLLLFGILGAIVIIILVAGAYLLGMNNATKKPIVYQSTPVVKPTVSQNPTSNWKIYTNTMYDYSFKIPSNYSTQECQSSSSVIIGITPQDLECDKGVAGINVYSTDQKNAEESIAVLKRDFTLRQKTLSINGINAVQYEGTLQNSSTPLPSHSIMTVFQNGSQYVLFSYDDYDKGKQSSLYSQILSTFQFNGHAKNIDTTNWKTYTNQSTKLQISYPANWSVKELSDEGKVDGVELTGAEGNVKAVWGSGFGGGCDVSNHKTITFFGKKTDICYGVSKDGSAGWDQLYQKIDDSTTLSVTAHSNPPESNASVIEQILSSFSFVK